MLTGFRVFNSSCTSQAMPTPQPHPHLPPHHSLSHRIIDGFLWAAENWIFFYSTVYFVSKSGGARKMSSPFKCRPTKRFLWWDLNCWRTKNTPERTLWELLSLWQRMTARLSGKGSKMGSFFFCWALFVVFKRLDAPLRGILIATLAGKHVHQTLQSTTQLFFFYSRTQFATKLF